MWSVLSDELNADQVNDAVGNSAVARGIPMNGAFVLKQCIVQVTFWELTEGHNEPSWVSLRVTLTSLVFECLEPARGKLARH